MSKQSTSTPLTSPTPAKDRVLAPDLARGMMLLLIALANSVWYLWGSKPGAITAHPDSGSVADRIVQAVLLITVDGRAYPMFAFLFAYGIGQMYARQTAAGATPAQVKQLLRRRHLWMIVFGFVHAALLWAGDIIGTYGLVGLIMMPLFFSRRDKTIKVWIVCLLVFGAVVSVLSLISGALAPSSAGGFGSMGRVGIDNPDYLASIGERVQAWLILVPVLGFATLAIPTSFLIGILASRHRIMEEPGKHLRLLRRIAGVGIAIGWLGGLCTALSHVQIAGLPNQWAYAVPHFYTGVYAGVGYAALFTLIAHRLIAKHAAQRQPVPALVALGRRSLSGYLAQSVLIAPVMSAWGLGLGARLSSWSMALVSVVVWLITVFVAYRMDLAGRRGPAEVALRRLAYGRPRSSPAQANR